LEEQTEYTNIQEIEKDDVNKLIIASYDIECDSSHGDFPIAKKNYKKLAIPETSVLIFLLNYYKNNYGNIDL